MALRRLATEAVSALGIRCGAPLAFNDSAFVLRSMVARGYATGASCSDLQFAIPMRVSRHPLRISPPLCARIAVLDSAKYAKSHEYADVKGDVATVGITDFAQVGLAIRTRLPTAQITA